MAQDYNIFATSDADKARVMIKTRKVKARLDADLANGTIDRYGLALLIALEIPATSTVDDFERHYKAWTQQKANGLVPWLRDADSSMDISDNEFGDLLISDLINLDTRKHRNLPVSHFYAKDVIRLQHDMMLASSALISYS